ncbi:MAG: antitoxin family protein [candidate division NC10 bacterium]|nr:antitoxin family protein [candidate division NC10 bacterium]
MSGKQAIEAVFEGGVFRPLGEVRFPEHQRVSIVVTVQDDLPMELLARAAELGGGFDFLANPAEDLYSLDDGEPV